MENNPIFSKGISGLTDCTSQNIKFRGKPLFRIVNIQFEIGYENASQINFTVNNEPPIALAMFVSSKNNPKTLMINIDRLFYFNGKDMNISFSSPVPFKAKLCVFHENGISYTPNFDKWLAEIQLEEVKEANALYNVVKNGIDIFPFSCEIKESEYIIKSLDTKIALRLTTEQARISFLRLLEYKFGKGIDLQSLEGFEQARNNPNVTS